MALNNRQRQDEVLLVHGGVDYSSPYFLSSSDSLGHLLVSLILTGENFYPLRRSMKVALKAKHKMVLVDQSLPPPPEE